MLQRLRRRLGGVFSPAAVERLDTREFSALVLALLALAAWLAAHGLDSLAVQRRGAVAAELRGLASSPVPYGKPAPRTAALLGPGAWRAFVRADSVPDAAETERLCALAADPTLPVRWLALGGSVPPCARAAAPVTGDVAAVKREIRSARWGVVDAAGRVRYNRRGVPTADELRRTLALLHPEGFPPAGAAAALPSEMLARPLLAVETAP